MFFIYLKEISELEKLRLYSDDATMQVRASSKNDTEMTDFLGLWNLNWFLQANNCGFESSLNKLRCTIKIFQCHLILIIIPLNTLCKTISAYFKHTERDMCSQFIRVDFPPDCLAYHDRQTHQISLQTDKTSEVNGRRFLYTRTGQACFSYKLLVKS